jgi:predicted nucleotidyltransferase
VTNAIPADGVDPGGLRARLVALRQPILELAERLGASNVRVFGSVARGDHQAGSDVDLLVDLAPGVTVFDLNRLQRELSDLVGTPVDVVSARALLPRDRDVLDEAMPL